MANTSATGGAISPAASPAPLQGQALNRFIQAWFAGMLDGVMPGDMIRPSFQPEPPVIPEAGDAWMAFSFGSRQSDTFPYIAHDADGFGSDELQRNEELPILCSFYDLGSGGDAEANLALLRDSLAIQQNHEALYPDFAYVACGDPQPVPVLIKERWLYRVDLPVTVRRQINRVYPVQNLQSANGTLVTDSGLTRDISVTNP